ncbi:ATP synthase protein I [Oryzomicrobium terrae]|uniref:ATP synthase protein I n=1 Tax=Oryzomicrobium terrae TaxID=1735038 RepID=A0A5C1ECF5_9RHOO|nr:ATP synthase subunit I [Oryzomicrobium terrae]QEL66582.1 ATP synthase protein I [Oryzomicrobium terrae]
MFRVIFLQLAIATVTAVLCGWFVGIRGAVSAALGAAAYVVPTLLFAVRLAVSAQKRAPSAAGFFFGEFVKIAATIGLLALAAKTYGDVHWPTLLIGLVVVLQANFLAFWKTS